MSAIQSLSSFLKGGRLCYETGELIGTSLSASGMVEVVNKFAITFFDISTSTAYFFHKLTSYPILIPCFNMAEGGFRLLEICRGFYVLKQQNPNIDSEYIHQTIVLNVLNIYRLGLRQFGLGSITPENLKYATLSISLIDVAIRMYSVFKNRLAIKDWIVQLPQNINFAQIGQNLDYIGRTIGHVVTVARFSLLSRTLCHAGQSHFNNFLTIAPPLTVAMTGVAYACIDEIFDMLQVQHGLKREISEWSIAIASSALLISASSVGLGLTTSIGEIYRRTLPNILISALYSTIWATSYLGIKRISNYIGFQPGVVKSIGEYTVASLGTVFVASTAAVGFGLAQSSRQAFNLYLCSLVFGWGMALWARSYSQALSLVTHGPKSWSAIGNDLVNVW